jgi:polar amino acid transport system substrate-binding protein
MQSNRRLLVLIGVSAVMLIAVTMLLALPGGAAGESADAPNAQATAPQRTPFAQDDLQRIKKAGVIVVGTSADYPPFEYYNEKFEFEGFDIELMNLIAKELGVKVEYKDFAFEGLADALSLGQVDAVIAALSVDPKREEVVDFTNVYYVGEDAILAGRAAPINDISDVKSMEHLRVGVQTGSVYENWIQGDFVDTGKLPPGNLMVYADISQGVNDLKRGLIDIVVLDRQPADAFVKQGGVKLVGGGFFPQNYALAVRQGSSNLRNEINRALVKLQNSGAVGKLAEEYLDLTDQEVLPIPTPAPTATPAPPQPTPTPSRCVDGSKYIADLNYDDNNMKNPPIMNPGQPFTKRWRVQNTGSCTWDSTYTFGYVQGNTQYSQMGGQRVKVSKIVPPGAMYDVAVNLVAPTVPGTYQGWWQFRNDLGQNFGERVYVGITVPSPATPTPPPPPPSQPGVSFTVDRTNIKQGECVTFYWDVQNVNAVYFYAQGQPWESNGVAGQGSRTECPAQTTTYELRIHHKDGRVEIRQITIYVESVASAPNITYWEVVPKDEAYVGQCVDIRWEVEGQVDNIDIREHSNMIWGGAPLRGSVQHCPPGTGEMEYTIEARGPGGVSKRQEHVTVYQRPQPR